MSLGNPAESSASSSAQTLNQASSSAEQQPLRKQAKRRRQELQQQCIQPAGLTEADHVSIWLSLLGISEEAIQLEAQRLAAKRAQPRSNQGVSQVSSIVKDSLSSSIPLDKDGWQVANNDLLDTNGLTSVLSESQNDDGWKVVKSKKSKRHNKARTSSTTSPPDSPDLGRSIHSSTFFSEQSSATSSPDASPNPDTFSEPSKHQITDSSQISEQRTDEPPTDQQRFPNLTSRDIEQVAKDVERSFIGPAFKHVFTAEATSADGDVDYPSIPKEKIFRRRQLSHLVLTTLSKHPALHYFQGYHDILSVVLLTLAPTVTANQLEQPSSQLFIDDTQQALIELIAERISLHVIRDSMTRDLLPVMGQLKILGNLLRQCDTTLADLVDRASPMPFFALPWLLTLLTHDATDIAVMQRVLEFILAYGPASAIYLCAAVLLARKDEILAMDKDELEDPAMLHTILSKFPHITADSLTVKEDEAAADSTEQPTEEKDKKAGDASSVADDITAIYSDPDVELPSLASDHALAATSNDAVPSKKGKEAKPGVPISTLLLKAVKLMERHPIHSEALHADKIMGPSSVIFTWPRIFDSVGDSSLQSASKSAGSEGSTQTASARDPDGTPSDAPTFDWSKANSNAESYLTGPTEAIVLDPHPPSPPSSSSFDDEKHSPHLSPLSPLPPHKKRTPLSLTPTTPQTRMLAVVGLSGLLVAALFTASQNSASSSAALKQMGTEETKKVLALVVSLLSNWGRVVGQ